ncbi:MAG TPA: ABC transporter substrate-binding protein [Verrucomicrobiae bacterium]|nr:ABC transporter substrate-binding protein [Verrucomicrobiae bacterium]
MSQKNSIKNWVITIVALIIVALIGAGAYAGRIKETTPAQTTALSSSAGQTAKPAGKELLPVKTWTRKDCTLTQWLVTEKLGYFAEEGIKLVFTGETQPAQQLPSILSGENDVGDWHPNTVAVAKAGGAKLIGVAPAYIEPGPDADIIFRHMWWFINPKSGVKSFSDLKNKPGKIKFSTITKNICADFLGNLIADKYGVPRDKIEWVTMPDIQAIQAVKNGLIDVAGVHPPFYKGMLEAGMVKIADSSDAGLTGPTAGIGGYFFSEDFVRKNPETVRRFVRAIIRGQKWANEHPDQAAKWTKEAIGMPVTGVHYYSETSKIDEASIAPWITELENGAVIPKGKITPADLVTHEFEFN